MSECLVTGWLVVMLLFAALPVESNDILESTEVNQF
jgi:hypothetical protein